jgi:2-iminobutanoate/2-iminopropanoate deaminase
MQYVSTINAPQAIGPYSQAITHGGLVYTSGQIALTADGLMLEDNITIQTHQVLKNLKEVLIASNSSLNNVIKTTIFLSDMEHFAIVNEIYSEYFGRHKPARSTVAVKTLPRNALVEIDAVAIVG